MIQRKLREVEIMVGGTGLEEIYKSILIKGVSTDSRKILPGQLFIPIKGERFNGHKFIHKAMENGAVASLWNRSEPLPEVDFPLILVEDTVDALQKLAREYRMQLKTKVVGITGSNGKTSTKDILAGILNTKYKTAKTFGNLNNYLGVPLTLLELEEDTEMAVVEMGISEVGEMRLLTSIAKPDIAIITNIGEAHLTTLRTKENIYKTKLEIVEGLKEDGLLIYLGDDQVLKDKIHQLNLKQTLISFGGLEGSSYRPILESMTDEGLSFRLEGITTVESYFLPLLGKHQMLNAAAAIGVAHYLKIPIYLIREGLKKMNITGMRNELIHTSKLTILNDAYKSNPSSLRAAIETLYGLTGYKQKIAVLGDMEGIGDDEISYHKEIGREIKPDQVDYLFTIGPLSSHIAKEAKNNFSKNRVISSKNKQELISQVKEVLKDEAIILVKASRGLELEEVVDSLLKEG